MRRITKALTTTLVLLALLALGIACVGCSKGEAHDDVAVRVMGLKGPTGIGMVSMMDAAAQKNDTPYTFTLVGAPDEVVSAVSSGSVDIAVVPTNLAATLYNKTQGAVRMIAIDALGSLYLLENGTSVNSMDDLVGKTIYATGQGSNPQYILEYLLAQAGLTVGTDVYVEYLSEHAALAAQVASGGVELALLPEPFVSTALSKNPDTRVALDLNDIWEQTADGQLAMGCVIAQTDFIDAHPQAIEEFLDRLEDSVTFAQEHVDETAQLCVDHGVIADLAIAQAAIPKCALAYIDGADMQAAVSDFFTVLFTANPASIGGNLPDAAFYYQG